MKKLYLPLAMVLISFIIFSQFCFAQIPYATKQPKWHFPIYFEDATGKKDTMHLGYDPSATQYCTGDPQFGEVYLQRPQDFHVYCDNKFSTPDSITKVYIVDTSTFNYGFEIIFVNVSPPLKIKFELDRLRSDSIPFPENGNFPKAQLIGAIGSGPLLVTYPDCSNPIFVASDTLDSSSCPCCTEDSLILEHFSGNNNLLTGGYLSLGFKPWSGTTPVNTNEYKEEILKIFPNPFNNIININKHTNDQLVLFIYDLMGRLTRKADIFKPNNEIYTGDMPDGLYFIRLENTEGKIIDAQKFIKYSNL